MKSPFAASLTTREQEHHDMRYAITIGSRDDDDAEVVVYGEEQLAVMMALVTGEHLA